MGAGAVIVASGGRSVLEQLARPASQTRRGGFGMTASFTGRDVTRMDAMGLPPFWSGVMLLAGTAGMLPLEVVDRANRNQVVAGAGVAKRLRFQPNPDQGAAQFWMSMFAQLIPAGNAYALKLPASDGLFAPELYLIQPEYVQVYRGDSGELEYDVQAPDGSTFAAGVKRRHIIHWRGPSLTNPLVGSSMVEYNRHSLGNALAAQEYQGATYRKGGVPKGILSIDEPLEIEDATTIRDQWHSTYGGIENAGEIAVLDRGATFQATGMTNESAQFVEQMNMSATDAARLLNLPAAMISAEGASMTYANASHNDLHFLKFSLAKWLRLAEEPLNLDPDFFGVSSAWEPRFNTDAIVEPDQGERYKNLQIATGAPWLDVDEARESEGLPPMKKKEAPSE